MGCLARSWPQEPGSHTGDRASLPAGSIGIEAGDERRDHAARDPGATRASEGRGSAICIGVGACVPHPPGQWSLIDKADPLVSVPLNVR